MSWITSLTCIAIPLLLVVLVRQAIIQQRERKVLRQQHPNEQWLWRRDWASRTATDQAHALSMLLWFFAVAWNLISLPVLFLLRDRRQDAVAFFFYVFPLAGVILIVVAIYQTLRRRKYAHSLCRFSALPIPLGRTLQGELETQVSDVPQEGFQLRLTCLQRIVRSSGKSTSVTEKILWQDEQRVGAGAAMPTPNGVRVPFRFQLPADGEPADERDPRNRVIWRLEAMADVPGIDYRGVFELPVFKTAHSPEDHSVFPHRGEPAWTAPPTITFGTGDHGGEQITIRPSSKVTDWIFYVGFAVLWFGALAFMEIAAGAPLLIVLLFGGFGAVVLYFVLDTMIGRSIVTANRTQLTSRRPLFGTRVIASADVQSLEPRIGTTTGRRALYDLEARLRDGSAITIARHLRTRRDAEGVAARILRAMGRS